MSGFKYLVAVVLAAATMLTAPATAFADLDVVVTIKPIHSLVARLDRDRYAKAAS
jgi:ABC-type Zn2+ transport system substrate-binding protein/surface adhesin